MAYRTLEITLISAKGLKDVNLFSKMAVYAVVCLSGDPRTRQSTPPDREGGCNPSWKSTFRLTVPTDANLARVHFLQILLRTERALGDRDVGDVRIPLTELISRNGDDPQPVQFVSYQVRMTTSGKPKGVLNFSYKLGEHVAAPAAPAPSAAPPASYPPSVTAYPASAAAPYPFPPSSKVDEPVMAYPVGTSNGAAQPYPPPSVYHQPPPPTYQQRPPYGYPPPGYEYGYRAARPPVAQLQRKNNFGMGLGAGLLGGALGGLLIGDMVSDAAAYDAGFDDAADFDF
ncbi:C2 domain [Musa troglodytarum]|uniref:C2 domain n=1 Tax=Musa troglodytarum TaxID=320322 RepID=A0A9E7G6R2_9LILI|nr:C2 domain [Musa troglodytarum]